MTRRMSGLLVPVIALVAMLGSGAWLVTQERDVRWMSTGFGDRGGSYGRDGMLGGAGMMGGGGMMGGRGMGGAGMMGGGFGWQDGNGRSVEDLSDARGRAESFAESLGSGLRVGEVMRFTNNYYAELEESDGTKATEVLVDPRTGAVRPEFGPAMMWNTQFGMMAARPGSGPELTAARASAVGERWLRSRDGLAVGKPETFPGYYTLHVLRGGRIDGMLSVHAVTGAVWYHGWHGRFLEMSEG